MSPRGWRAMARGAQRARAALNRPDLSRQTAGAEDTPAPAVADASTLQPRLVRDVCDRSGDIGSHHVWADGSTVGEFCVCSKRKKFFVEDSR
jgi:hypothetical protein